MTYLKRAWLSITRRKGKSLLLFMVIFILANVLAAAISIQQATQNVEKTIKSQMGATATIRLDFENMKDTDYEGIKNLDKSVVTQVGDLSYVKYYDYTMSGNIGSESLESYIPQFIEENSVVSDPQADYFVYTLRGVQSANLLPLEVGAISLVDGRTFTEEELSNSKSVVMISKELADKNNLSIGDRATFTNYILDYNASEASVLDKIDYPLEIIGIYQNNRSQIQSNTKASPAESDSDDWNQAYNEQLLANQIYVPNKIVEDVRREFLASLMENMTEEEIEETITNGEPLYILKNSEDLDAFKQEAHALLPQHYIIYASLDEYDNIAAPVQSMSKMVGHILMAALVTTILIITLLLLLFLRDRKHELGNYLDSGESKLKLVLQILLEVFIVAFVAVSLSLFSGNMLAKGASDRLIQNQISQQENDPGFIYNPISEFNMDVTLDDVVEEYQVRMTASYVGITYAIVLGTILLAAILPMSYIVRMNPKEQQS